MRLLWHVASLVWLAASQHAFAAPDFAVPELTSPVMDRVGVLGSGAQILNDNLRRLSSETGTQLVVYVVPSLYNMAIEDYSIRVTDQWKLGKKGADRGVLLLVAPAEHRVRIEVGRGLEGDLTDSRAKAIIDTEMLPRFRAQNPGDAIFAGTQAIVQITDPAFHWLGSDRAVSRQSADTPESSGSGHNLSFLFVLVIFFILVLTPSGRLILSLIFLSGGGRGGGGDGGGSGGFGGGGGGFSGGGASGGW